jgi:hypothetical protein
VDEVWAILRAGEYLPANYRKFRAGNPYRLVDVLAALEDGPVESGHRGEDEGGPGEGPEDAENEDAEDEAEIDWDGETELGSDPEDAEADWDAETELGSDRGW